MTAIELPLVAVRLDGGTQVRATVDQGLVEEYAQWMQAGAAFPPIAVFYIAGDGPYLVDGFHRYHAAQRAGLASIWAEAHTGTRDDALWFALGANRTNGQRLTEADKTHAVQLALQAWPERVQREIAAQVGCSESLVSKVALGLTKTTGGDGGGLRGRALAYKVQRDAVRAALLAGEGSTSIRRTLRAHSTTIASIKRELGLPVMETRPVTTNGRQVRIEEMAAAGHSSAQIAAALGISEQYCRELLRRAGVTAPGDAATHGTHRHNSTRIMARIVADAEDLSSGANLIDFNALDHDQIPDWIETLRAARTTISRFITRLAQVTPTQPLQQEEPSDGEATHAQAVQGPSGPDRADAGAHGARGAA